MLEVEDRLTLAQMRIGQHLGGIEHRPTDDAAPGEGLHDLTLLAFTGPAFDLRGQRGTIAGARRGRREALVRAQIGTPHDLGHRLEHLRIVGRNGYVDIVVRTIARAAYEI